MKNSSDYKPSEAETGYDPELGFERPIPMVGSPIDAIRVHEQYAAQVDLYRVVTAQPGDAHAEFVESNSTNVVLAK